MHERHVTIEPGFRSAHLLTDLCAALAAADALGVPIPGHLDVAFSALRGERIALPGGVTVINDCYNANPMSMRAALDDLAATAPGEARRRARRHARARRRPTRSASTASSASRRARQGWRCSSRSGRARSGPARPSPASICTRATRRAPHRSWGPAARRRHRARQGLARRRARARGHRSRERRLMARDPDRRHRLAPDLHLPRAEVHRVPAPPRVRPARSRRRAAGAPRQGGDADDGRDHHDDRDRHAVRDLLELERLARDRGLRHDARLRAARLRRRLHEDRQAPVARPARAHQARRCSRSSRSGCGSSSRRTPGSTAPSPCASSTGTSTWAWPTPS